MGSGLARGLKGVLFWSLGFEVNPVAGRLLIGRPTPPGRAEQ